MKVVHLVPVGTAANAGMIECVRSLARHQTALGADAALWLMNPVAAVTREPDRVVRGIPRLARELARMRDGILHLHGIWNVAGTFAAAHRLLQHQPVVLSPHGMLMSDPWSRRAWKKLPYWHLFERRTVENATLLHVTSAVESEAARRRTQAPIVVFPHGANPAPPLETLPPRPANQRDYIVFLGRLHPIKNLEALLALRPRRRTRVLIAGDGDPRYRARLEKLAKSNPALDVQFIGWIDGLEKWTLLRHAKALVLPSHSENFASVVLEALTVGTPVIASHGTPWESLESTGAGKHVDTRSPSFAEAVDLVLDPEWDLRRAHALRLAARFSWETIARQMLGAYASMPRRGGRSERT